MRCKVTRACNGELAILPSSHSITWSGEQFLKTDLDHVIATDGSNSSNLRVSDHVIP